MIGEITPITCAPDSDVVKSSFYVPPSQAKEKYGRGVSTNFDVIQISIVNKCQLSILLPLAGIYIKDSPKVYPFSLDHVTSVFSYDRVFSGPRAWYFNILQAAATIGSSVQPFLASGFTQGVAIFGGSFTQGSAAIWKDMSAAQLQNLTSQAFQSTEQVGPNGGSLQRDIFLPKLGKTSNFDEILRTAKIRKTYIDISDHLKLQIIPITSPSSSQ